MKWEICHDPLGQHSVHIEWHNFDLIPLDLDQFEFALLRECDHSDSFADKLLALEMLVRKWEHASKVGRANP
jgi:hypothetical protein